MEKRVVLAIALTILLYFVYFTWFGPAPPPRAGVSQGSSPAAAGPAEKPVPAPPPAGRAVSKQYDDAPDVTLGNGRLDLTFAARGGAMKSAAPWACAHHEVGKSTAPGDPGVATAYVDGVLGALEMSLVDAPPDVPDLAKSNWKLSKVDDAVVVEFETAGLRLRRAVRISTDPKLPWSADVECSVENVSADPGPEKAIEIVGPVMPKAAMGDDGVLVAEAGEEGGVTLLRPADMQKQLTENPRYERHAATGKWAFIAARADFYLGALIPNGDPRADTTVSYRTVTHPDPAAPLGPPIVDTAAPTFRLPFKVPAKGEAVRFAFTLYAGPNQRTLLSDESSPYHVLSGATVQRTFIVSLGPIVRFMAWMLGLIASTGIGYGYAVLVLTIVVRGAMFPLSRHSQISMRIHSQKMQKIKPRLDAIKEKYKDPKKQQEMTMKAMREEKVKLLPGGCLLAFLQMPIWIALYNVLQTTFEMRHASFFWAKDLTAPDNFAHFAVLEGVPLIPATLNLLPILMMATWYASAAMQPLPADPQQAQQAKMMRFMPLLMGVFLYTTASGLSLYMTMSALWSIGETWLIRKVWLSKLENALK